MNRIPNDKYVDFYSFNTDLASAYYVPGTLASGFRAYFYIPSIRVDKQKGRPTSKSQCSVISEMHKAL